ncbi:MAG TPA: hypothetical protein VE623_14665 [Acidimicrobiales bacterium]|jgi:hypothetical protein|nr:hypothetical protein [Acidimicrobiales bacterium]
MRLLKRHPDEDEAEAETAADESVTDAREESAAHTAAPESPSGRRWGRRTVTVPMTLPERSVKRTAIVPSRSAGRTSGWARLSLGPLMAIMAGAALAVVGCVALIRTGIDGTWFRPRVEVLDADHTALLGALEVGAGLVLLLAGLAGSRVLVAVLGLAMALAATAIAIEPEELQRELAIERWWAWALAAVGVVLTLAALQAPFERRQAVVDVT